MRSIRRNVEVAFKLAVVSAVLEEPDDAKADIADSVGKPKKKNSKRKMKKSSAS